MMQAVKSIERDIGIGIGVFVGVMIVGFWRYVPEAFDLTKAVLLLVLSPALALFVVIRARGLAIRIRDPRLIPAGLVALSLFVSVAVAERSATAFIGQDHRFTGAIAVGACLLLYLVCHFCSGSSSFAAVLRVLRWFSWMFIAYGFVQWWGVDPFKWTTETFTGTLVFSTQGNPNFASWTCAFFAACAVSERIIEIRTKERPSVLWLRLRDVQLVLLLLLLEPTDSLQGNVGVVVCGVLLLIWSLAESKVPGSFSFAPVGVGFLVAGGIFAFVDPSTPFLWVIATFVFILIIASGRASKVSLSDRSRTLLCGALTISAIGFSAVALSSTTDFLSRAAGERPAFYRAAWRMFVDRPLVGFGFEQYGFVFSGFRPEWHATRLEFSLPSSAHSIPLGILSAGGLVLAVPTIALVATVFWSLIQKRRDEALHPEVSIALAVPVVVVVVVSMVAVEQISILASTFTFFGFATGRWHPLRNRSRHLASFGPTAVSVVLAALLCVSVVVSSRWIVGNRAQAEGLALASNSSTVSQGIARLDRSIELGPMESFVKIYRALVLAQTGQFDRASDDAIDVARYFNYSSAVSRDMIQILSQANRLPEAFEVARGALINDPYSPSARTNLVAFTNAYAEFLDREGRRDEAESARQQTEALLSGR